MRANRKKKQFLCVDNIPWVIWFRESLLLRSSLAQELCPIWFPLENFLPGSSINERSVVAVKISISFFQLPSSFYVALPSGNIAKMLRSDNLILHDSCRTEESIISSQDLSLDLNKLFIHIMLIRAKKPSALLHKSSFRLHPFVSPAILNVLQPQNYFI